MIKTKVIPIRLDAASWELIRTAAAASGRSASAFVRHAAVEASLAEGIAHPSLQAERRRLRDLAATITRTRRQ